MTGYAGGPHACGGAGPDTVPRPNSLLDRRGQHAALLQRQHQPQPASTGVRGPTSDNSRTRRVLGWQPTTNLKGGLVPANSWVEAQLPHKGRSPVGVEWEGSEDR